MEKRWVLDKMWQVIQGKGDLMGRCMDKCQKCKEYREVICKDRGSDIGGRGQKREVGGK